MTMSNQHDIENDDDVKNNDDHVDDVTVDGMPNHRPIIRMARMTMMMMVE